MGLAFVDDEDQEGLESILVWLEVLAKENFAKMSFAFVGKRFHARLSHLGASGEIIPTIVVIDGQSKKYPFDEKTTFNKENVAKFINDIFTGATTPFFKSEPVPETNDEPVKVVVGKTFDSIVLDNTKDVLIEFYAPWCGHCKSLVPIYNQLGEHYQNSETIIIAKMDATANDNNIIDIPGYPAIYLFPAGQKDSPISFDGDRTFEGFVEFIQANRQTKGEDSAEDVASDTGKDEL